MNILFGRFYYWGSHFFVTRFWAKFLWIYCLEGFAVQLTGINFTSLFSEIVLKIVWHEKYDPLFGKGWHGLVDGLPKKCNMKRATLFMSHYFEQNLYSFIFVVVWSMNSTIPLPKARGHTFHVALFWAKFDYYCHG